MKKAEYFDSYPCWIILLSTLFSFLLWGIGAFIIYQFGLAWLVIYLLYLLFLELRLVKGHCVDCYYYGKYCAFGKGRLSSLLFRQGNPKRFSCRQLTMRDILPDFLVSIIPFILGIVLLVRRFSILLLILILALLILSSLGNGFVRGTLACRHCRQRKLGCPAEKLFSKPNKSRK